MLGSFVSVEMVTYIEEVTGENIKLWRGYGHATWLAEASSTITSSFTRYVCRLYIVLQMS